MDPASGLPQPLVDLAFAALDHAVGSIANGGGPLIPLVFIEQGGGRRLIRGAAERLEEGLALVRAQAAQAADAVTAVAFDGYVTIPDGRFDAIYVEARDPSGKTLTLAQRYQVKGLVRKRAEPIGNPIFVNNDTA